MEQETQHLAAEIKQLRSCINDLVGVLALPALWSGGEPTQIARTLLDVLLGMLRLDLVYVRMQDPVEGTFIEMARLAPSLELTSSQEDLARTLTSCLADDPQECPAVLHNAAADDDLSILPLPLGLQGELGVMVAGSRRADFPGKAERLLLSVAANQAVIGLQEARLRSEQKRVANELDQRVAQRTAELAAANEKLRREIAERELVDRRLRQEERELKRSEALLAEAQRLSSTGSFSWRVTTDEITWSEQTYRIHEVDPATPVTLELIASRIHPEDIQVLHEMVGHGRQGRDLDYHYRLRMRDDSIKYLHLVAHAADDQEGRHEYIGAIHDVTQPRLAEEALGRVRSELAHVARVMSLGALTASIAHEVNQPLAAIVTNATTCLRMLAADPPNLDGARRTVQRTIRDGNYASEVIMRLRALFARKDAVIEPVDLNEATREVIALSLSDLQRNRVIVRTMLAEDLPSVSGDRVQLQQVILNLVRNASDAMSGVDDRPRQLTIRTQRDEADRVRFSVEDAGVGFEPQRADQLFDAFFTTKSSGMGIGLSVSRSIIESHHGRLWAARNEGPGATFSFCIPSGGDAATEEEQTTRASSRGRHP